jgi:probable F420-dependent oxidoreductase
VTARWGMTIPFSRLPLADHHDALRELVALGYTDVWTMETGGLDALTPLATVAALAPELRIGSAIASVFTRGPALLAMSAAALAEAAPGRFVLGIGASSETIATDWNGIAFDRPFERVRDTLRFLRGALAGERVSADFASFESRGFLLERSPQNAPPIYLAALRERMLRLAGSEADGVILSLLGAVDVPTVVACVRDAAEQAGRSGSPDVVLRLGVCMTRDLESARAFCRRQLAAYLNVPSYAGQHRWLGRAEELAPVWKAWRDGDRAAAAAAVPDAWVDALYVLGPAEHCREQIARFVEAGVTTPVLSVMVFDGDPRKVARALAPER